MTDTLVWDDAGARYYETGVSRGTFFPINGGPGVPWNGLVSIVLDPQGGEHESYYYDGIKFDEKVLAEDFQATIQAISTPPEFRSCEGVREYQPGVMTEMNKRDKFHMTWRTEISNDQGESIAYKLHIAYNNLVQPSGRSYQTLSDTTTMDIRNFVITATPACGRHSYFWFDSREYNLSLLEAQISMGVLPKCQDLAALVSPAGGGGGGGPTDPDAGCPSTTETFEEFVHGQTLSGTYGSNVINGVINNGLDTVDLPAGGAFAANDSAASEVGTSPTLTDDDDATYITSADGDLGYTVGLPPLVGYVEGCTFELHIRMAITGGIDPDDPDNLDADAQVHIATDATGDTTIGGFSDGTDEGMGFALSAVDGTIVDYVVPLSLDAWVDTTLADVVTALQDGAYLDVVAVSNNNPDPSVTPPLVVNVYEAHVVMLNDSNSGKFLRSDGSTNAYLTQKLLDGGSPAVASHTASVEFQFLESDESLAPYLPINQTILSWDDLLGDHPGRITAEFMSGWFQVDCWAYDDTPMSGSPAASFLPDPNVWYKAEGYWNWSEVRFRVWALDDPTNFLIDVTLPFTAHLPTCDVSYSAGWVSGDVDV